MFPRSRYAIFCMATMGVIYLTAGLRLVAQAPPTSSPTTSPASSLVAVSEPVSIDELLGELHPPSLEEILSPLQPLPDLAGVLAMLPESATPGSGEERSSSQPVDSHLERIAELEGQIEAHIEQVKFQEVAELAGELVGLCEDAYGRQDWRTLDARSLSETFGYLAKLAQPAQTEFSRALQLQPKLERLFVQNRFEEAKQLVLQRLNFLHRIGLRDHPAAAEDWITLATLLRMTSSYEKADLCFREGLRIYRDRLSLRHPDAAAGLHGLAWLRYQQDDQQSAETLFCAALSVRLEVLGGTHEAFLASVVSLASYQQQNGGYAAAERLLRYAQRIQAALPAYDLFDRAETTYVLAGLQKARGNYPEAERLYHQARSMMEEDQGHARPGAASCLNNLGTLAWLQGDYVSAVAFLSDALRCYYAAVGERDADVIACRNNLAEVFMAQGKLRSAEAYARDACRTARELLGDRSLLFADSATTLAMVLCQRGEWAEAESLYRTALEIRRAVLGERHLLVARSENNLALLLRSTGQYDEASQLYSQALETKLQVLGANHPETAEGQHNLATLFYLKDDKEEAERRYRRAAAILQQMPNGGLPSIIETWHGLAVLAADEGDYEEAERILRQVVDAETKHGFASSYRHKSTLAELLSTRLGRPADAIPLYKEAIRETDELRGQVSGDELDLARYCNELGRWRAYGGMARAQLAAAEDREHGEQEAFRWLEQGRGRALLSLLDRAGEDIFEIAAKQVANSPETARQITSARRQAIKAKGRLAAVERQIATAEADDTLEEPEKGRLLRGLAHECKAAADDQRLAFRRLFDWARSGLGSQGLRPMDAMQVAGKLKPYELLLLYDVGVKDTLLLILRSSGLVTAHRLEWPDGTDVTASSLTERVTTVMADVRAARTKDIRTGPERAGPVGELAATLLPVFLQPEFSRASCVFLIPDGPLCGLPFEMLVAGNDSTNHAWQCPPMVYGSSATVLMALRNPTGRSDGEPDAGKLRLLAVGDPVFDRTAATPGMTDLTRGVLVLSVTADSNAARSGMRTGDVILRYAGVDLDNAGDLKRALDEVLDTNDRQSTTDSAAIPAQSSVPVQIWRDNNLHELYVKAGSLGITASAAPVPAALRAHRDSRLTEEQQHAYLSHVITREGFKRFDSLRGTRYEVNSIAQVIRASGAPSDSCRVLLGEEATLSNLLAILDRPRYLHLATHASVNGERPHESALAFTVPVQPALTDDGFLRLGDLLYEWGGRLEGTELVVLSACHGAAGRRAAGEGLMALTWGFLFAGADSVLASLWEADDRATALLMHRFYENHLGVFSEARGGYDAKTPMPKGTALLEAKQWLSRSSPEENRRMLESMAKTTARRGQGDSRQRDSIVETEDAIGLWLGDEEQHAGSNREGNLDTRPGAHARKPRAMYDFSHPYYWAGFILIGDPD